jgi:hypothetical protein
MNILPYLLSPANNNCFPCTVNYKHGADPVYKYSRGWYYEPVKMESVYQKLRRFFVEFYCGLFYGKKRYHVDPDQRLAKQDIRIRKYAPKSLFIILAPDGNITNFFSERLKIG